MAATHPLLGVPPHEFIKARNALVRELRERGEAQEAERVAALRRPSVPLFIVNQLGRRAPEATGELIESTQRARQAQVRGGGGDQLREAMHAQRQALHRLLAEAGKAAAEIRTRMTPDIQRRVQDTLQGAAAADPEALREGTVEAELPAAGFAALLSGRSAVAAKAESQRTAFPERAAAQKEKVAARREEMQRQRSIREAEQTARRLDVRARQLEQIADRAAASAGKARAKAREARAAADAAAAHALELRR